MENLMVYLKTTETCQLDCSHCFTSGKNGAKGWFDPEATIDFFKRYKRKFPSLKTANISFHGGEPMICPIHKLNRVYDELNGLWDNLTWGIQTNLTYVINDEKMAFFKKVSGTSIGTSWDYNIRWGGNAHLEELWENNVRKLLYEGIDVTVMVCITKDLIQLEPLDVVNKFIDMGVPYINFERVTRNGSATINDVAPTNAEIDNWLFKLWKQTIDNKLYEKILNMFFESILTTAVYGTFNGCRSRECEQKILTLNATGTIGGCPNSAPTDNFGHITDDIDSIVNHPKRMCAVTSESIRNNYCYTKCDHLDICNGDCHQLNWEGDLCASPKSIFTDIKQRPRQLLVDMLAGFTGTEGIYGDTAKEVFFRG